MRIPFAAICVLGCSGAKPTTVAPMTTESVAIPLTAATATATMLPIARQEIEPPWSLTASDGSGLVLTRVDAKAVMEGPLAFTELHLWFRNTENRQREGRFQITLPSGAAVSRFAMENYGTWMEAEVVPKQFARRAYEDFLHRRQDPALLEKAAGNQFTARVFPIFARAEKHLVISYSQELPGARYTLPLRGLPTAERVSVEFSQLASDGTKSTQRLNETQWQADRDFVATAATTVQAVASGTLVAAQVEVAADAKPDVPRGITLLVDTSASRSLGFTSYVGGVKKLVDDLRATWGDALPLQMIAFDQDTQLVFEGRADELRELHVKKLVERGAAGASDLGQALEWIAHHGVLSRVVIVGDGVITAGREGGALQAAVKQLPKVERLDVVLAGGLRDERAATQLVRALAHAGAVLDLERDAVAAALGETVATDVAIEIPAAAWVYPRKLASARAGTKTMVFARVNAPAKSLDVNVGGMRQTLQMLAGTAPLVERALASAEISELETTLAKSPKDGGVQIRQAIAKRSTEARVLSSETAMLVLESESDYARYKIDRKALADVLVVGANGVQRVKRADITPIPTAVAKTPVVVADGDPLPQPPGAPAQKQPAPKVAEIRDDTPDNDRDGILDVDDKCPGDPEAFNGQEDDDGCPDRGRLIVTDTAIIILDRVHFENGKAVIKRESLALLDAIVATMQGNVEIELVEIQGHTDERDDDLNNLKLSERRAKIVMKYLVDKGVDPKRLEARGYGETQPLDPRHNAAAWAKNRRVEFLILKRRDGERVAFTPRPPPKAPEPPPPPPPPVTGELAEIHAALRGRDIDGALAKARDWHDREPGNVLALVGLGEALEAAKADATAARVYGSIIDLFPGRADMRRFAGERLSRLQNARDLTIDTYRRAVADRPDHLTGHRLLAYSLVRANKHADAFAAIVNGLGQTYRETSFVGGMRILKEDAAMIGAAYAAAVPAKRAEITATLATHELAAATTASTRFVLYWETDANDVDFHIRDAKKNEASYQNKKLATGGELYADVTNGYGPECFAINGKPTGGPYELSLEYYSQGPMGYGMGLLQIQKFDGKAFRFDDRPFVIMRDHARVDLGVYR